MGMFKSSRRDRLTSYKPTMRQQAVNLFAQYTGDDYEARNRARNLFGGDGRMGLLDWVPVVGQAFALEEAGRKLSTPGQRGSGAFDVALAMVPVPAAVKGGKKLAARKAVAGKAAKAAPAPEPGFVAYHGSPHTFDQFDTAKIGTGEGAQAYGHGLYFAENEDVARSYRDALVTRDANAPGWNMTVRGTPVDRLYKQIEDRANRLPPSSAAAEYDKLAAIESLMQHGDPAGVINSGQIDGPALDWFKREIAPGFKRDGSMYQVRINADPNDFLDWDRPLHQQPEHVQNALRSAGAEIRPPPKPWPVTPTASGRYTVRNGWGEVVGTYATKEKAEAIAAKGWGPPTGEAQLAYTQLGGNSIYSGLDKGVASKKLQDAGIPGIRYLDQGSRGAGEGSRNFVVFDPRIIDIMKRYGVAAPVAAAILAGTMQPPKGKEPGV